MKTPEKLQSSIVKLLTDRISDEHKAFYFYRAASNWCKDKGFFKASAFFQTEATDELEHSKKLQDYLVDWNVVPELPTIESPAEDFSSLVEIIEKAYDIEYALYEEYEDISMTIFKMPDPCTFDFLQEFRTIQRTSVAEYSDKLNVLNGVEPTKINLLLIEKNLF